MFVYQPALLMIGDWPEIILSFVTSTLALRCLPEACTAIRHAAFAWQALLSRWRMPGFSGLSTDLAGAALAGSVIIYQVLERRSGRRSRRQTGAVTQRGPVRPKRNINGLRAAATQFTNVAGRLIQEPLAMSEAPKNSARSKSQLRCARS